MVFRQCACEYVWFDALIGGKPSGKSGTCKVLEDLVAHVDRGGLAGLAMLASSTRHLLWPFRKNLD